MPPCIMVFEEVIGNDIIQRDEYAENSCAVHHKPVPPHQQPRCAVICVCAFGLRRAKITECAEQGPYKRGDHKKMTESPRPEMFAYELCIQLIIEIDEVMII